MCAYWVSGMRNLALVSMTWLASMGFSCQVKAEEGASGHYQPGSLSSRINKIPPNKSVNIFVDLNEYEGKTDAGLTVPVAGLAVNDMDMKDQTYSLNIIWNPGIELKGGGQYAMALALPYRSLEVFASQANNEQVFRLHEKSSGLGDIMISLLMLSYPLSEFWQSELHFNVYAPTGSYEVGQLANVGKNYWSFSPVAWLQYIEPVTGQEFTLSGGIDWNTKNDDTDYQTGTQMHIDSTVIQYVPLLWGFTGLGLTGYWYQQLSDDSGSGAKQGGFKAKSVGFGPILSYRGKWSGRAVRAELEWINEMEVKNRTDGDFISFKFSARF